MENVNKFIQLANFYNQLLTVVGAICVKKGGIPIEQYVGRFFIADVLEFLAEYGEKLRTDNEQVKRVAAQFKAEYEKVRDLTTPSQKPIYEMTLEEFEKIMNI